MRVGDGADCMVATVAVPPPVAEDPLVLHAGEAMFHAGADFEMFDIIRLLARQERQSRAFAVLAPPVRC